MIQTNWVIARLRQQWPHLEIAVEHVHTTGDHITDRPLAQIGGDGVFVTEIERALREGRIDLAVHSLKDLPTMQPEGVRIVVPGPREDVRDVLASNVPVQLTAQGLRSPVASEPLPPSLRLGTGSLRRAAQIRAWLPDVQMLPLRGNVDTRLRKLAAGDYDAILLAAAGLHRLAVQPQVQHHMLYFPADQILPAPGQGALGLEIRDEPALRALVEPLRDVAVQASVSAERMFMRRLGAGCYLPVAAYGDLCEDRLRLQGLVISLDGQQQVRVEQSVAWYPHDMDIVDIAVAEQLGSDLAEQALEQGASAIIQGVNVTRMQEHQHV
jgi:hydroxymethylbilane synthase